MSLTSFYYVLDETLSLLFADDDPILREFARVHLSTDRADVTLAADGLEAMEAIRTQKIDLVLLDLEMPGLDGFGVLEQMRSDPRFEHIPVIVVTGREDVLAIDKAFEAGATSFIVKPINWRLLSYQIRYVSKAHAVEMSLREIREADAARIGLLEGTVNRLVLAGTALTTLASKGDGALKLEARRFAEQLGDAIRRHCRSKVSAIARDG